MAEGSRIVLKGRAREVSRHHHIRSQRGSRRHHSRHSGVDGPRPVSLIARPSHHKHSRQSRVVLNSRTRSSPKPPSQPHSRLEEEDVGSSYSPSDRGNTSPGNPETVFHKKTSRDQSPVSPVSVGSSVFDDQSEGVFSPAEPATPADDSSSRLEDGGSSLIGDVPKQPTRRRVKRPKNPVSLLPVPAQVAVVRSRKRKRRRVTAKSLEVIAPTAATGEGLFKSTPSLHRQTAVKSIPSPPANKVVAKPDELTKSEQAELQEHVFKQLKQRVSGDEQETEVLAEFVSVLLEQQKSANEMTAELAFLGEEAKAFVNWLEKTKADILSKRPQVQRQTAVLPVLHSPCFAAQLTPNDIATSLQDHSTNINSAKARSRDEKPLVVITEKLVLQPNRDHVPLTGDGLADSNYFDVAVAPSVQRVPTELEKRLEEAHTKKMELLAEMTKKLQVILARLSDKSLDDSTREKYQTLAQTIQNQIATLSRPPKAYTAPAASGHMAPSAGEVSNMSGSPSSSQAPAQT